MQSPDAAPPVSQSNYSLWIDVLEDIPNLNIDNVLDEVAAALFDILSPADTKGYTPAASIKVATDADVQALNRDFRDTDKPTNVLSFPSAPEDALVDDELDEEPHHYLGDIILAVGTLLKEAETAQKPISHHLAHLTVHGLLHLMGFDHETEADAAIMEALEIKILATLNINNPYENT